MFAYLTAFKDVPRKELRSSTLWLKQEHSEHHVHYLCYKDYSSAQSLFQRVFPNIQPQPPLALLEAIPSCPVVRYLEEEASSHLTTTHFQTTVESNEISLEPHISDETRAEHAAVQHQDKSNSLLPWLTDACRDTWANESDLPVPSKKWVMMEELQNQTQELGMNGEFMSIQRGLF